MDYTTVTLVKAALHAQSTATDTRLAQIVTEVSRAIDRFCTGVPDAVDYMKLEDVSGEILRGQMDFDGRIICYPHKPIINTVSAFSYRDNITGTAYTVDTSRVRAMGGRVESYPTNNPYDYPSTCEVTISYNGGLGVISGSSITLPQDLVNAATLLAVRFYREEESGLTDAIGVAELGTLVYTEAWPKRVVMQLEPYRRRVGWRWVS